MIEPAVALGSLMEAQYTLQRVIKPVLPPGYKLEGASLTGLAETVLKDIERIQDSLHREAQDYLERVAAPLRARALRVQTKVAVEQQPGMAILHEASASAIDLIALETHGRRGLSRLVLGSVADKVIRGASGPVLVQRPVYT
jgi:nucleotide-binding universal stress UspA family protein